jgi:hypothetical protein
MAGFGLTHPDKIAGQCKKIPAIGHPICSFSLIKTVSRELQEQKHGKLFNIMGYPDKCGDFNKFKIWN